MKKLIFRNKIAVTIQKCDPDKRAMIRLNPMEKLSNIRVKLKKHSIVMMEITYSFARKTPEINNNGANNEISYWFAEIAREDEEELTLREILEKINDDNILYLVKNSSPDWKFLNKRRKLSYGCKMTFDGIKKANKRAFKMKCCDLTVIGAEGFKKGVIKSKSKEDWMMKKNLFFSADVNVQNFIKLGVSSESLRQNFINNETNLSYRYMEYGKISLNFGKYLKPSSEFNKAVEEAIESQDPKKFKIIIEEFGQFVPTEVILGGRMYFESVDLSTEQTQINSKENTIKVGAGGFMGTKFGRNSNHKKGNSSYCNFSFVSLIGGEQPDGSEDFDKSWVQSLKDYRNWDCIEYRNPVSIFSLLSETLRKRILTSIGKRVLYSNFEDRKYRLIERGGRVFELNIPSNIMNIIHNKDSDCNFFATVVDQENTNDLFNCQILCPSNGKPSVIVHCIQKEFKRCKCHLKIGLMVIGYDTNYNFMISDNDSNVQIDVLKKNFDASSSLQTMFNGDSLENNIPCLGIPVLDKLDSSNNSLIIGHYFFGDAQAANVTGYCTFSYCLRKERYVNLPNFNFYTLTTSKTSYSDAFGKTLIDRRAAFANDSLKFISLNLYSAKKLWKIGKSNNFFLKQDQKQITIYNIECKCKKTLNRTCDICREISNFQRNVKSIECAFFDSEVLENDKNKIESLDKESRFLLVLQNRKETQC
ncbi:unnamed protein product [Rhizophagus irregularis]|nr:unnamed protein product [Rhizophagus irregularis]